jgi:hypothetical protein
MKNKQKYEGNQSIFQGADLPSLDEMSYVDILAYIRSTPNDHSHHKALSNQIQARYSIQEIGALVDLGRLEGLENLSFFVELRHLFE